MLVRKNSCSEGTSDIDRVKYPQQYWRSKEKRTSTFFIDPTSTPKQFYTRIKNPACHPYFPAQNGITFVSCKPLSFISVAFRFGLHPARHCDRKVDQRAIPRNHHAFKPAKELKPFLGISALFCPLVDKSHRLRKSDNCAAMNITVRCQCAP